MFAIDLLGHSDSIRDIDYLPPKDGSNAIIASSAQDKYIRLWELIALNAEDSLIKPDNKGLNVFDEFKSKTSFVFKAGDRFYNLLLDSVLLGHEHTVSSVQWGTIDGRPALVSASFDYSVCIWQFDDTMVD